MIKKCSYSQLSARVVEVAILHYDARHGILCFDMSACGNLQYSCLGLASFCNSHYCWCSSLVVAATRLLWQVILNCQTVATHKLNWQEVGLKEHVQ